MTDLEQRIKNDYEDWIKPRLSNVEPGHPFDAFKAGYIAALPRWIPVSERLPEERPYPYQVIGAQKKEMGGVYDGFCKRKFVQDWHVRNWPQNFVAWAYDPLGQFALPTPPEGEEGE